MRTPASIAGHPIHPMLIVFPVGLFIFSLICDLISLSAADAGVWRTVALYTMGGGFIGALAAAVPGLIDLLSVVKTRVRKIALTHMVLNLIAVLLYAINLWLRIKSGNYEAGLILSIVAVVLLSVSGWLGAEMVHRHGIGVESIGE
jgi:uncharacterized membrane protein